MGLRAAPLAGSAVVAAVVPAPAAELFSPASAGPAAMATSSRHKNQEVNLAIDTLLLFLSLISLSIFLFSFLGVA
jgi:hypothetical protein